ncbi:MAG TPA: M43 family zinc metalloprotease, partial [Chitinophagaceae bacterium]|nr:M43 family zinc metalloprotease [Chitinophagaceae bacterium]
MKNTLRVLCAVVWLLTGISSTTSTFHWQNLPPVPHSKTAIPYRHLQPFVSPDLLLQREDTGRKALEEKLNTRIVQLQAQAASPNTVTSYLLPVVVHIISDSPWHVTDQKVIEGIQNLNEAFSKTGAYAGGDNLATPGADTHIRFCLAQTEPDGGNSTGITRTKSFYGDFDKATEDGRMKNLIEWDTKRYTNIWLVDGFNSETLAEYHCGQWTRGREGGYAPLPMSNGPKDGVVVAGFGPVLAHELGHYLGLYHTFEGQDCANTDCSTDGDKVCDTPPDASPYDSPDCSRPDNSCKTDSLSGPFTRNVPDMISNFMDYSNYSCHTSFTAGQGERMRNTIALLRNNPLLSTLCNRPCAENILASFTRINNSFPVPGENIVFNNTSTGATQFEWSVDGQVLATSRAFSHAFADTGRYKVTLKAYNGNAQCFAAYSDFVIVTCGVAARFYADKYLGVASELGIQADSVLLTNRSVHANTFHWLVSSDAGMAEQEVSNTSGNLSYVFPRPAKYKMRLVAANGSCVDTTEIFTIKVDDPRADAGITVTATRCNGKDQARISFFMCNNGIKTIPVGMPVSFYDADPSITKANIIGQFLLPDSIKGVCCGYIYETILHFVKPLTDTVFVVVNDQGKSFPLQLPNNPAIEEAFYPNNKISVAYNSPRISILPADTTVTRKQAFTLQTSTNIANAVYNWQPDPRYTINCACPAPVVTVTNDVQVQLQVYNNEGCVADASAQLKILPPDMTMDILQTDCYNKDSTLVSFRINMKNGYDSIFAGTPVAFYPSEDRNAGRLLPAFNTQWSVPDGSVFKHVVANGSTGQLYGFVNDKGGIASPVIDQQFVETNYNNNSSTAAIVPFSIRVSPADTSVPRMSLLQLNVIAAGG